MTPNSDNQVWWNVFAFPSLKHICAIKDDANNPRTYDPRIGGDGNVIWQRADTKGFNIASDPRSQKEDTQ